MMNFDRKTELKNMLLPDSPKSLTAAIAEILLQATEELSRIADSLTASDFDPRFKE